MKLKQIFPRLSDRKKLGDIFVKGISDDSRLVNEGEMFFVRPRKNFDIFSVLGGIEGKTAVFVAEEKNRDKLTALIKNKPVFFVDDIEEEFFRAVNSFYDFRKDDLKFIGVTGTNGKTTVTQLIYYLLKQLGQPPSLIGTVNYLIGEKVCKAGYTTPDYLSLKKIIKEISDAGSNFVVMEVSSHGIAQGRVKELNFLRKVFTNLSRDHLDYHKTMADYFNVKKGFFLKDRNFSIINIDDPYGTKILKEIDSAISYGIKENADMCARNISITKRGAEFNLVYKGDVFEARSPLLGRHNVLNILAGIGVVFSLGFPLEEITKLTASFYPVDGRLEQAAPDIFVDYAHTPDALEKVMLALKEIGYDKIICVFGCGGNRDKGKRKIMGEAVSRYAAFTFITLDNPRGEDPLEICSQIEKGFEKKNYAVVTDRKEAIEEAVKLKEKYNNCCVLIAGKGHEDYQIIGDRRIPFKDREVIRQIVDGR